jgi:hypothetical protein
VTSVDGAGRTRALGVTGLVIAPDGTIYASAAYSASDGAATALARQQNGAFSSLLDCVGVTSGTGCGLRMASLAGASAIAGSPDGAMQNVYVASRYTPDGTAAGTDGALSALTRELPPSCSDGSASTPAGSAVTIPLPCSDPNGDALSRTLLGGPSHGTLDAIDQGAGTVVYRPAAGASGADTFTISASDGTLGSAAATVTLNVAATPPPPPPPGNKPPAARKAKVTAFSLAPARFAAGTKVTHPKKGTARGTTFKYTADLTGRVRITVSACRRGTGAKRRDLCAKRTLRGTLGQTVKRAGKVTLAFTGRFGRKSLVAGRYRATITLTPAKPNTASIAHSADFTVVRASS